MALSTPFTCWKTPCTPQKQPPAKIAVSAPLPAGSSMAGAGILTARSAALPCDETTAAATRRPAKAASATGVAVRKLLSLIMLIPSWVMKLGGRPRDEAERNAIHAVAEPGRLRPVVEDMAEMSLAEAARHLGAGHAEAVVGGLDYILLGDRLPEARPAGA